MRKMARLSTRATTWYATRREAVCVDVARLAHSARRIVAKSTTTTYEEESNELNSFDPLRWFDDVRM